MVLFFCQITVGIQLEHRCNKNDQKRKLGLQFNDVYTFSAHVSVCVSTAGQVCVCVCEPMIHPQVCRIRLYSPQQAS